MTQTEKEIELRRIVVEMEMNVAEANRELANGGWLSDHTHAMNQLRFEYDAAKKFEVKP